MRTVHSSLVVNVLQTPIICIPFTWPGHWCHRGLGKITGFSSCCLATINQLEYVALRGGCTSPYPSFLLPFLCDTSWKLQYKYVCIYLYFPFSEFSCINLFIACLLSNIDHGSQGIKNGVSIWHVCAVSSHLVISGLKHHSHNNGHALLGKVCDFKNENSVVAVDFVQYLQVGDRDAAVTWLHLVSSSSRWQEDGVRVLVML